MSVIELRNLTKDYGDHRGIFDLTLNIEKGEMVGFVGTNGSGKTTTIRSIMGFIEPSCGTVKVNGLEAWDHSSEYVKHVGYVPGEIAFLDLATGTEFLKSQANFLNMKSMDYANELIEKLQLDPRANLKRMSKGMKQKTALVAALMNNPDIILLDEPTTGLDPLMRDAFLEIIKNEHQKGKTIFMSSHMFEEMEETCDRVALINDGRIIDIADMHQIHNRPVRDFKIEFKNHDDFLKFETLPIVILRKQEQYNQVTIRIDKKKMTSLFRILTEYDVKFIAEVKYTLERHFNEIIHSKLEKENN